MEFFLFAIALLLLLWAGLGLAVMLMPRFRTVSMPELGGLAFMLGCAFVSLTSFVAGFAVHGAAFKWVIALLCLIVGGAAGVRRFRSRLCVERPAFSSWYDALTTLILLGQTLIVAVASYRLWLGWDALLIWEFKARVSFLNGGGLPVSFFQASGNVWPHPFYPLLLPLTEAWFYHWFGQPHQAWVKLLQPFYYLAFIGLLYAFAKRAGASRGQASFTAIVAFLIPALWMGEGSVTSGYADFPLAVGYLLAAGYLAEYCVSGNVELIRLVGIAGAILCWTKDEGMILWMVLMLCGVLALLRRRALIQILPLVLPGALLLGSWKGFLKFAQAPANFAFHPISWEIWQRQAGRLPEIFSQELGLLLEWRRWTIFWPVFFITLFGWLARRFALAPSHPASGLLFGMVLFPLACYLGIFIFSAFPSVSIHIGSSYSRLLVGVTPVALLAIVTMFIPRPSLPRAESEINDTDDSNDDMRVNQIARV